MTDSLLKALLDTSTLVVLALTLIAVIWHGYLIRRTLTADTFVQILERADRIKLSQTMDLINLWSFTDYLTYTDKVPDDEQVQVRALIDFFNDLSHLARSKYVDDYYPIRLYFSSLMTCRKKLMPWWLDGIRTGRGSEGLYLYNNFEALCDYAKAWEERRFKRIGYRAFLKAQGIVEL
jgi:hypothetical protein